MHLLLWINRLLNITRCWTCKMNLSQSSDYQSRVIIANAPENVLFNRVSSLFTCFYQQCYQNLTRFGEKIRLRGSSWEQAVIDYSWYTVCSGLNYCFTFCWQFEALSNQSSNQLSCLALSTAGAECWRLLFDHWCFSFFILFFFSDASETFIW